MSKKLTPKVLVQVYTRLAKKLGVHPTRAAMKQAGVSRDHIRHHFGSLQELRRAARKANPQDFAGIIDDELFSKKRKEALHRDLKRYRRFVITTAVTGAPVHKKFLQSIKTYCANANAQLLVLIASDPGSHANDTNSTIDKKLMSEHIVMHDLALNSNIFISTIKLSAKHIDPITGLGRIGQREGTFIYASPKQRMKPIPTSNEKPPHVLMTTGAITKPKYTAKSYWNARTAYIADHDHVMGAIIVEVVDNKYYHFRQIQAEPRSGNFVDLGVYYQGKQISKLSPEAFVLGDSHVTETDASAESAWEEAFDYTGAKDVVLHDMFSGVSINHHERKKNITRAILANKNKLNLEQELRAVADYLNKWTRKARRVYVVESNHHEFLSEHYLQGGDYQKDPQNYLIGAKLAAAMIEGHNPLRYALEKLIGLENPDKVVWLSRDEDYKVAGIELGAHGDKGANGSRGSLRAMENAYTNSVSGHSHTPEILRGAWQVGTSSYLKLSYNKGPSSWMHASCLVYQNGSRQMIISINGRWHLE